MWFTSPSSYKILIFFLITTIISGIFSEPETNGIHGKRRKNKRSKEQVIPSNNRLSIYDQVAESSDHGSEAQNVEYISPPYGMRLTNNVNNHVGPHSNKARNPRADPNYLRNYHQFNYAPREAQGGPPPGNWGDGRQMTSSFNLPNLQAAASSNSQDYAYGDVDDNTVAAGHNHGWSSGHGQKDNVNGSAVGLLGFLTLLSLIQNVLRQMTTTATTGRRRRETRDYDRVDDVTPQLLPLLASISYAHDGMVPVKCALRPYCQTNSIISHRLGQVGDIVCDQLSSIMESSVGQSKSAQLRSKWRKVEAIRHLRLAATDGKRGRNCVQLYPHCKQLDVLNNSRNNSTNAFMPQIRKFMSI